MIGNKTKLPDDMEIRYVGWVSTIAWLIVCLARASLPSHSPPRITKWLSATNDCLPAPMCADA